MAADEMPPGLWLIGIGPGDLEHMTEKARRVARGCNKRYLEGYTALLPPAPEEEAPCNPLGISCCTALLPPGQED